MYEKNYAEFFPPSLNFRKVFVILNACGPFSDAVPYLVSPEQTS